MADVWANISTQSTSDLTSAANINQLITNIRLLGGNATAQPSSDIESLAGAGSVMAGTLISWATETVQTGYLECDGSAVSRATYSTLFSAIGCRFGKGDGTTTFNVPDMRGRHIRGFDNGATTDPDADTRTTPFTAFDDATCDTTNGDATITMDSTANIVIGMSVSGVGIPADAYVLSITNATTFELSANATATNTDETLTFTLTGDHVGSEQASAMWGHKVYTVFDESTTGYDALTSSVSMRQARSDAIDIAYSLMGATAGSGSIPDISPSSSPVDDGTNGTPNLTSESRPVNTSFMILIKY